MDVDQTYATVARVGIETRFGAARETVGDECTAYVEWETGDQLDPVGRAFFTTVAMGRPKKEGAEISGPADLREQALAAIEWSREQWPDPGALRLLWRCPPVVEHQPPQAASRKHGIPALPAKTYIYMRLAAVPLDVNEFRPRKR